MGGREDMHRSHRCSIHTGCVDSYLRVVDGSIQDPFMRPVAFNTLSATHSTGGLASLRCSVIRRPTDRGGGLALFVGFYHWREISLSCYHFTYDGSFTSVNIIIKTSRLIEWSNAVKRMTRTKYRNMF